MPRHLLDISKDGELTSSCWNLCQSSVTFTVKKSFLMFRGHCHVIEWCHQLPLVILRTYHERKSIDYGHVTEELVREIAQAGYEKGWTSQGWQVGMKKGKEKWPVGQATPLFFPCSAYYSQMPGQGHDQLKVSSCLLPPQNSPWEMTTLQWTDKTALSPSCIFPQNFHTAMSKERDPRFLWVAKRGLAPTWTLGTNLSHAVAITQLVEYLRCPMSEGGQWLAQHGYFMPVWEIWDGHPWP